jgi:hypothetical protein
VALIPARSGDSCTTRPNKWQKASVKKNICRTAEWHATAIVQVTVAKLSTSNSQIDAPGLPKTTLYVKRHQILLAIQPLTLIHCQRPLNTHWLLPAWCL